MRSATSRVGPRFRIVIPKKIRDAAGIKRYEQRNMIRHAISGKPGLLARGGSISESRMTLTRFSRSTPIRSEPMARQYVRTGLPGSAAATKIYGA
jgi:bifunctional DNA-binding transcriptional regulator/antitoxin component of YhaV-PrlF toxin-antitoxin module